MPDPTRAGRTSLRLVEPDERALADPFAAPQFVFLIATAPRLRVHSPAAVPLVPVGDARHRQPSRENASDAAT